MKGLEQCETFYLAYGKPMLEEQFGPDLGRIAVGLAGHGSECFGFDDELSKDHDFAPRFYLWVSEKTEREIGFRLSRAYANLQRKRGKEPTARSLYGGGRGGVTVVGDFFAGLIGSPRPPETMLEWLQIPDYALAAATNGKIFRDDEGLVTAFRAALAARPEDVVRKKIAARAALMAQSGQYNYARCLRRGERSAAHLAADAFVRSAAELVYLLNRAYAPHEKWLFRGLRNLPVLSAAVPLLEELLQTGEAEGERKIARIEEVCALTAAELRAQGLSDARGDDLEPHALAVTAGIRSADLKFLHLMEG